MWSTQVKSSDIPLQLTNRDAIYKSALDLYDYFTYVKVQKLGIPLLILANKQDQEEAANSDSVEKQLKREV